jgi:hypothetical protein
MAKTNAPQALQGEASTPTPETPAAGDRPAHEMRLGRVRCSIWRNQSDKGPWYSVRLTRLYKTDDGWKASPSLGRDDLLPAAKLCEEAALWVFRQQQQTTVTPDGAPPPTDGGDIPF